ncbi:MAG: hypothetical protein Q9188_005884 [Gyalolechia gomerana]
MSSSPSRPVNEGTLSPPPSFSAPSSSEHAPTLANVNHALWSPSPREAGKLKGKMPAISDLVNDEDVPAIPPTPPPSSPSSSTPSDVTAAQTLANWSTTAWKRAAAGDETVTYNYLRQGLPVFDPDDPSTYDTLVNWIKDGQYITGFPQRPRTDPNLTKPADLKFTDLGRRDVRALKLPLYTLQWMSPKSGQEVMASRKRKRASVKKAPVNKKRKVDTPVAEQVVEEEEEAEEEEAKEEEAEEEEEEEEEEEAEEEVTAEQVTAPVTGFTAINALPRPPPGLAGSGVRAQQPAQPVQPVQRKKAAAREKEEVKEKEPTPPPPPPTTRMGRVVKPVKLPGDE